MKGLDPVSAPIAQYTKERLCMTCLRWTYTGLLLAATLAPAQTVAFRPAGAMTARFTEREAVLLADGRVLATGGYNCVNGTCTPQGGCEIYDPAQQTWRATGSFSVARGNHALIRLADGRVIAIGGRIPTGWTSATEIFDPATGLWTAGPRMREPRYLHRAVLLPGGRVLVTGGRSLNVPGGLSQPVATAELLDTKATAWSDAAAMSGPRFDHALTLLADGRVLAASGFRQTDSVKILAAPNVEVYDPAANAWTTVGQLASPRTVATSIALPDGRVLITGGINEADGVEKSTDIYHPDGRLTRGPDLLTPRAYHTATVLPSGRVLIAAGYDTFVDTDPPIASSEFFDAERNVWVAGPALGEPRAIHAAVLLRNGQWLQIGGYGTGSAGLASTELLAAAPASGEAVTVPVASYADNSTLAPDSLAAAFGTALAPSTQAASGLPWPAVLAGVSVTVRDAANVSRPASLLLASAGQVNFLVPRETALGLATILIRAGERTLAMGPVRISGLAPALFAADGSGQGLPAGSVVRAGSGGTLTNEPLARFDAALGRFVPVAVAPGTAALPAVLVLAGSGLRGRSALSAVQVTIGALPVPVQFAGPSPEFPGLDQLNVSLPESLAGAGLVDIVVRVDGREANVLRIQIR